jgi:hypothetical protein
MSPWPYFTTSFYGVKNRDLKMLRSLTSVARWLEYMFVNEGNPHFTSGFVGLS